MLADAELSSTMLFAPDSHVPARCVNVLLERSAAISGVESFGLRMAEFRCLSNLGPVGMAVRDQPTLREALAVLLRHLGWLNGAMSLLIEESAGTVVIREDIVTGGGEPVRQSIELATGVLVRLMRHFLGPQWRPRRICFTHAAPRDLSTHLRMFGPCVEFNYDFNGVVCAAGDLDFPNPLADPGMARYAQQLVDSALQAQAQSMTEDVRRTALLLLPLGRCGIDQVALHLGVVSRTVQRRLAEEGTSFSSVVNELRVELAQRFVNSSERPITEVAALLGFSASSGFSRWHQSQFGCSSSQARQQPKPTAACVSQSGEPRGLARLIGAAV